MLSILPTRITCPAEMVAVAGRVCVDRYEGSFVDGESGAPLSPFYPPSPTLSATLFEHWTQARESSRGGTLAAMLVVPRPLPLAGPAVAVSRPRTTPAGYVSADTAAAACQQAGKRLCTEPEWVTACRGEAERPFPYGATYEHGACNVYRESHPAYELHGSASRNHRDPRLNLVAVQGEPLLRSTGTTPKCASQWGTDAIYDMVGNLDEWVDHATGAFVGGFYSRGTRSGCHAKVSSHPRRYYDYSTGFRCCKDPE